MTLYNKENNISSAIAKGFVTTLLGSGTAKIILVLATFIFTHLLTKDDFGSFSFVRNTLNVVLIICALNYVELLTKFTAELEYDEKSLPRAILLLLVSLTLCVLFGLFLLFIPDRILLGLTSNSSLNVFFRIIGLCLPLFMIQPLTEAIFRGLKMFKLIGILQIGTAILFVLFVVIGAVSNGMSGAITGLLIYYLVYSILSIWCFFRKVDSSLWKKNNMLSLKSEMSIIWTMILPVFILSFVEAPVNWWSQVLMTKYDSMSSVGSMSAILQIRNSLIIIPNYFFSTFITYQATMNAEGKHEQYFSYLKKSALICVALGIILSIAMCLVGPFVLGLYGKAYITDSFALIIAMISFPFLMSTSLLRGSLIIKEHQRLMLVTSIFASISQIACMYILLPKGIDPVVCFFWSQFAFNTLTFVVFCGCCIYDYRMIKA